MGKESENEEWSRGNEKSEHVPGDDENDEPNNNTVEDDDGYDGVLKNMFGDMLLSPLASQMGHYSRRCY